MTTKEETMCAIANRRRLSERGARFLVPLMLTVTALAIMGLGASSASAGNYNVQECNPDTNPGTADLQWSGDGAGLEFGIHCYPIYGHEWDKGITFHPYSTGAGPRGASATFYARPTTHFESGSFVYEMGAPWFACGGGSDPCWVAYDYVGGSPAVAPTVDPHSGTYGWTGSSATTITEAVSCQWSYCPHNDSTPWYYDFSAINRLNLSVADTERPTLALGGSLFNNQIAHGTPSLQIDSTDRGGGVEGVSVEVNGVRIATPATACPGMTADRSYATQFRACNDYHQTVALDTTKTPWVDGQNTLRVCAADVATGAGVANQTCDQRAVSVDNTCQDSQGATGQAQSISAGLEDPKSGQLRRTRTVRSSDPAAIRGELTGASGPVKAASVCVYETVDEPAGIEQLLQVAKTSSTGNFGVELPGGPSRTFLVAYRYNDRELESPSMYLESSVLPSLKVTKSKLRNGRAVGFRGRIPGPDADGRAITMQAKVGKKWRSFKQLSTDPNGQFHGKYRFTQTRGRAVYLFRAVVKKQGGYPYSPGASRKRKVVVRG
jgi:hypothetical protein